MEILGRGRGLRNCFEFHRAYFNFLNVEKFKLLGNFAFLFEKDDS